MRSSTSRYATRELTLETNKPVAGDLVERAPRITPSASRAALSNHNKLPHWLDGYVTRI
jgi:hypothetical protein